MDISSWAGRIFMWVSQRPNVEFLSVNDASWHYVCENGDKIKGAAIIATVLLCNNGMEDTNVHIVFEPNAKLSLFESKDSIELSGKGKRKEIQITLTCEDCLPSNGENLQGTLKMNVWGAKRLFWGNENKTKEIVIPCKQSGRIEEMMK